jgi:hypothetical protein
MRDLAGELLFAAGICVAGGLGLFVWRSHPVIATMVIALFAMGAGWVGYRVETIVHPDRGLLRRAVLIPTVFAVVAVVGAYLLWAMYCPCE